MNAEYRHADETLGRELGCEAWPSFDLCPGCARRHAMESATDAAAWLGVLSAQGVATADELKRQAEGLASTIAGLTWRPPQKGSASC